MEALSPISTLLPPRTRLYELKQSAHFPFDEVQHSIKTWINMASLLVKQGLMAESQKDDENAYISYIRACMIMTKIIPHQACYAAMMNDIACIDLRQKILGIVTRLGNLERRLLEQYERDSLLQRQQQEDQPQHQLHQHQASQQQSLLPGKGEPRFLQVTTPELPVIEARTSSLGATTLSRPSSTEPHISTTTSTDSSSSSTSSLNGDRIEFRQRNDFENKQDDDDDYNDARNKNGDGQARGENAERRGIAQGTAIDQEEEIEGADTNMIKIDIEQQTTNHHRPLHHHQRDQPAISLLDVDDPILEYGAKDQICQARVQVDMTKDNEIVISERGSSNEADIDEEDEENIAEEEAEMKFELTGTREGRKRQETSRTTSQKDNEEEDQDAHDPHGSNDAGLGLDLNQASYAVHRRKFLQQQHIQHYQQQEAANFSTASPLSFPAGNVVEEKEPAIAAQPRPRQSLTIYRTSSHECDERSAFFQHAPELEGNHKGAGLNNAHVRRCSSSDGLSRSGSLHSNFPGKYFPQSQAQPSEGCARDKKARRISPPPRSPHRISAQILGHFPSISAPLPTPPPPPSLTTKELTRAASVASTMLSETIGRVDQFPAGRPSLSPSSPRQSMDQMSVQGSSEHSYPSNKASGGSLPINLQRHQCRATLGLGHASTGSMSSNSSSSNTSSISSSAYSSPISSPALVQNRQMSNNANLVTPITSPASSTSSPSLTGVATKMATSSSITTSSMSSDGSTTIVGSSISSSKHAAMSSISSMTTVVTNASSITFCRPETPPTIFSSVASSMTMQSPPSASAASPTLHSYRKPGLLRKIRSRPKVGDHHIFEMVDTTAARVASPPPMGLLMHANANSSIRG